MKLQTFYYKAWILRDNDLKALREGTLIEKYPVDALDRLVDMSVNLWKRPLVKIELYETQNGVLVASITVGDRVNAVLEANSVLRPDKFKNIERKKHEPVTRVTPKPLPATPYSWAWECGDLYTARTFSTYRM
jgi:hypothetical protein